MENNNNPVKLEITQDKLVDLLLHAATREDIARLDAKIDHLDQKIDFNYAKLDQKIDASLVEFKRSIETMEARMDRAEARMDRKFFAAMSITIASSIAIIGILLRGFHMF